MAKVIIIGPAHPLRGGLATFNQRLAKQFSDEGHDCSIVSFSMQYPSFLFPGTTQYSTDPAPAGVIIHTIINSINPLTCQPWQKNSLNFARRLKTNKAHLHRLILRLVN